MAGVWISRCAKPRDSADPGRGTAELHPPAHPLVDGTRARVQIPAGSRMAPMAALPDVELSGGEDSGSVKTRRFSRPRPMAARAVAPDRCARSASPAMAISSAPAAARSRGSVARLRHAQVHHRCFASEDPDGEERKLILCFQGRGIFTIAPKGKLRRWRIAGSRLPPP